LAKAAAGRKGLGRQMGGNPPQNFIREGCGLIWAQDIAQGICWQAPFIILASAKSPAVDVTLTDGALS